MSVTREIPQIGTSSGYTFVSYVRHDLTFALTLAGALRNHSVPVWIDRWCIEPGADWNKAIDAALRDCASFLIVLSPEAVASDEVRGELTVALNTHKHVIPLLHRPCEIPRQLLIRQWIDFTQSSDLDDASVDILVRALRGPRADRDAPLTTDRTDRQALLQDVRAEATERLRSIGADTPFPILLERQPHQVVRPWDAEVSGLLRRQPGPPVTDIVQIFDDPAVVGRLLILGEPGSGKTTVLLQLVQQLVSRADQSDGRPVPVLIALASWKTDEPIDAWFVNELKVKYGVRTDVGRQWLDAGRINPLFDGLDELPAEHQAACVEAINSFQQVYRPAYLVVCSRRAEYENLTTKLRLHDAVCLLPLERDQIRTYLDRAGSSDFWNVVQGDPDLMEMARSPLLLSFMSALPHEPVAERWQDAPSTGERRRRLFEAYVSSRTTSEADHPAYSREQTLRWLRRLATALKGQTQAEFLIERMQPNWLESPLQRWSYRAGVLLVSAATVLLVMLSVGTLFEGVPRGDVGLALRASEFGKVTEGAAYSLTTLLVIAIAAGCLIGFRNAITPIETLSWSWSSARENTRGWAKAAMVAVLDYGLPLSIAVSLLWAWSQFDRRDDPWQMAGELAGNASGVLIAIFLALIRPGSWLRTVPRRSMKVRLADALALAVLCGLISGWTLHWSSGVVSAVGMFLIAGFSTALTDRCCVWLLRALSASVIAGAAIAIISRPALPVAVPLIPWLQLWVGGAFAAAMIGGLTISLIVWARESRQVGHANTPAAVDRKAMKTAAAGLAIGVVLGAVAIAIARSGGYLIVRGVAFFWWYADSGLLQSEAAILLGAIGVTGAAVMTGGVPAALAGALSGAFGADVERRLVPNQGIRQSALNVVIFSALGLLVIGIPYGMFNLSLAALMTGTLPTPADFMSLVAGAGATFGLLAGLLPGAACIQHFVLRFVLWASGTLPLRYAHFLNFATRRRLLQRVGGRYRFIHVLLRDHLAAG